MRRCFNSILCACLLAGCAPAPKTIDDSQSINAGVNIVPEAVQASMKIKPSSQPTDTDLPDVIDVIQDSDEHHYTLIELLRTSGLIPVLQEAGPYTILAPTDEAFSKLPPGTVDRLLQPSHHAELLAFLKYHLMAGRITASDMLQTNGQLPTLGGVDVIVKGIGDKAMVNDANVIRSDAGGSNGTVHWLDTVLLPPA
jgi:uncharacterized surface protein with fasciclin (FAS1) repeats